MSKIKLLFVVYDFFQAGAERYAYEIDRALNKEKFKLTILCLHKKNQINNVWKIPYYYNKHKDLGTDIVFFDKYEPSKLFTSRLLRKIKKIIINSKSKDYNPRIIPFLKKFDLIHWLGEYTYLHHLPEKIREKSLISSMSAKFQNAEIYSRFDYNLKYNIVSGFSEKEREFEFSEFKYYKHWFIPLMFKISLKQNKWKFKNSSIKKIGIFTRLDRYKPLDPFFYAFHLLLDEIPNSELHIFGNGNPEKEGLTRYLKNLNVSNKVFFRGHQEDIAQTALNEHIDISWFQGYNNDRPSGYAGFDICSTGTPLICWDFLENPTNPFNELYPHYKNLRLFVRKSVELLSEADKANDLSNKQFNDVIENRDIEKKIYLLENVYYEVLGIK